MHNNDDYYRTSSAMHIIVSVAVGVALDVRHNSAVVYLDPIQVGVYMKNRCEM